MSFKYVFIELLVVAVAIIAIVGVAIAFYGIG